MSAKLTLDEARAILKRAVEKAAEVGWVSTYVVVDAGGNLISLTRMDGAPPASAAISRAKAYLAAVTGGPSMRFCARVAGHPERYDAYQRLLPSPIFPGPGAMTIVKDGEVVGGFASSSAAGDAGMRFEMGGKKLSREDVVTAYALQIPYLEQHGSMN